MAAPTAYLLLWYLRLTLAVPDPPDAPAIQRFEFVETHMGSPFKVVLYTTDAAAARRASQAAYQRIAELDAILSDYDPESELMKLCAQAGGPPVRVSAELFDVVARSMEMSRRSGGAFDVTVGPVVRLWRRARRTRKMPDPELLARARALVGFENVLLDARQCTIQLRKPGMKLDLGGIAKGYASGAAIGVLKSQGIERALVAGAGDIVVSNPPPGTQGWRIGIAPLEAPGATPSRFILLQNAAVSTSGDAERYVEIEGQRYSHIVDPKTGLGLVDHTSVTIVARDGATADALATAVYVLGPQRGLPLVDATDGAAALIMRLTSQGQQTYTSLRWAAIPAANPTDASAQSP